MKSLKFFMLSACMAIFFTGCDEDDDDGGMTTNPAAKKEATVYASSNNQDKVSKTEFSEDADGENETSDMSTYTVAYADADGIYYDSDADILYQNDRSNNQLRAYTDFSAKADGSSIDASLSTMASATIGTLNPLQNGREIAKSGNKVVIAQSPLGASVVSSFYIYTKMNDSLYLSNVYLSPVMLWGIQLEGNTMYAIEDNSSNVVAFNDFFNKGIAATLIADMTVSVEGIVRTHGINYDADADVMVLTDIGDAGSDNDGAFTVITDWNSKMSAAGNGGMISLSNQIRVEDADGMLGNPVDCAYDSRTDKVYIAERANAGGRIMAYDVPSESGSQSASYNTQFDGASAVYLHKK